MADNLRVAVLIESSTSWGHDIIKGISAFARQKSPWFFYIEPRGRYEQLSLPKGWSGDGVIARVTTERLADELVAFGKPAVNVSWYNPGNAKIPRCTVSEASVAKLAAEHLLDRGFRNFGYCGPIRRPRYSDQLRQSFFAELAEAGCECSTYNYHGDEGMEVEWQDDHLQLVRWLTELPKPVGILAWSPQRGRHLTEACQYAGLQVPEEIAIIGSEYDELTCEVSTPELSTVDASGWGVGYAAAQLLQHMVTENQLEADSIYLKPNGVITRPSSDVFSVDDPLVFQALQFIKRHAYDGITVHDVLDEVVVARRTLEKRFEQALRQSPAAVIRRIRIEHAKRLLIDTDQPVPKVATLAGFIDHDRMTRTFKRELGETPSAFRKRWFAR